MEEIDGIPRGGRPKGGKQGGRGKKFF